MPSFTAALAGSMGCGAAFRCRGGAAARLCQTPPFQVRGGRNRSAPTT
eukprot:CAMPEP_0196699206 /NCGR_PEP_ID=MMETSP1090-20130531/46454_1 /TAXON_ID=37098 /ORGANISM="Isochrysis sp, Strain CCMP1244" /LENGTH=47 /DNA_ID= /DNA_START= /DNA_END= /DNA_ORIENTATION=